MASLRASEKRKVLSVVEEDNGLPRLGRLNPNGRSIFGQRSASKETLMYTCSLSRSALALCLCTGLLLAGCTATTHTFVYSPHDTPFTKPQPREVRGLNFEANGEFKCPCHGSLFHEEGTNYDGPAPKALKWYELEVTPEDGELVVDLNREVDRDFRLVV